MEIVVFSYGNQPIAVNGLRLFHQLCFRHSQRMVTVCGVDYGVHVKTTMFD